MLSLTAYEMERYHSNSSLLSVESICITSKARRNPHGCLVARRTCLIAMKISMTRAKAQRPASLPPKETLGMVAMSLGSRAVLTTRDVRGRRAVAGHARDGISSRHTNIASPAWTKTKTSAATLTMNPQFGVTQLILDTAGNFATL